MLAHSIGWMGKFQRSEVDERVRAGGLDDNAQSGSELNETIWGKYRVSPSTNPPLSDNLRHIGDSRAIDPHTVGGKHA